MKYWELIADKLASDGWTWGVVSYFDGARRKMICADAHRDAGRRLVVHAEDASVAFAELEAQCQRMAILTEEARRPGRSEKARGIAIVRGGGWTL